MVYMVLPVSLLSVYYAPGMCPVNHEIRALPCRVSIDQEPGPERGSVGTLNRVTESAELS